MPRIRILTSKGSGSSAGVYPLAKGQLGIGRSVDNAIVLHDSLVSRHHALIETDGKIATIRDVGGKNPIRINGEEVRGGKTLTFGDHISIGQTEMVFENDVAETAAVRVVPGESPSFDSDTGAISLEAATVRVEKPDFRNLEAAERYYDRLSGLYSLSESLLSAADAEDVYDALLATAMDGTGAERGFVATLASEGFDPESLNVIRFWDPEQGKEATTLEMSESILRHIQRERHAVLVRDVPDHNDFGASVIDLNIRSFVCVPIARLDRVLGLIYVDTRGIRGPQLDRGDLEFVSAVGRIGGVSLESLANSFRLRRENEQLRSLVGGRQELIGSGERMRGVLELVEKVAPRDASVLITGENGTGKELVARAIHNRSARKDQPFVAVNCAAIPHHLVESELFGHEKGAFTGAVQSAVGKFDMASGGTLFLDEIGDMPLDMQVKILRALQERCFYRVGGQNEVSVDIRVVSATNRDLQRSIEDGSFREDLFFRLAVVTIEVPPLRERGDDVIEIAGHFLGEGPQAITLTKAAKECLRTYHWPGNVRELRNVLEQAIVLGDGKRITPSDLPPHVRKKGRGKMIFRLKTIAEVEKQYIRRVLDEVDGNKAKAATILGISRETLYQKLRIYAKEEGSES